MINRAHRFHGHASLNFVYKQGKTIQHPLLAVKYVPNTRRKVYRVAVVVSKKVHKSAVKRNRVRRRLYENVRLLEPYIHESYDIVMTVHGDQLIALSAQEMQKLVHSQLTYAKILSVTPVRAKIGLESE